MKQTKMVPEAQDVEAIVDAIRHAEHILAITHISPDGDAIGSLLGLGWVLEELGKDHILACADRVPRNYRYLPGSEWVVQEPHPQGVDLVVSLDASDPGRMGTAYDSQALHGIPLANIDHHVTNVRFGTWNWVDPSVAAATMLVLELLDRLGVPLNEKIALCLLNGLATDTRGFRTSNTTVQEMKAATRLMKTGASLSQVMHHAFNQRSFSSIRLWGATLQTVKLDRRIIWGEITLSTQRKVSGGDISYGGLANFILAAEGADVSVVFTEAENGDVDVGFRAMPGMDISGVAQDLGGGGHPQAAGCTLAGPLSAVRRQVLATVAEAIRDQKPLDL